MWQATFQHPASSMGLYASAFMWLERLHWADPRTNPQTYNKSGPRWLICCGDRDSYRDPPTNKSMYWVGGQRSTRSLLSDGPFDISMGRNEKSPTF